MYVGAQWLSPIYFDIAIVELKQWKKTQRFFILRYLENVANSNFLYKRFYAEVLHTKKN